MAKKTKNSVSVTFVSLVESISDKSQIKEAYKDLAKQITTFAEAVVADPNAIISHSTINIGNEGPTMSIEEKAVNTKIAELQTIGKRIAKGDSPVVTPGYKSKFEVKEEKHEDETEAVIVESVDEKPKHWVPPTGNNIPKEVETTKPKFDPALKGKMQITIFSKLRKTDKSLAIVDFFLSNMDKDVSVADIADHTKLKNVDISNWLQQTGQEVKAIKRAEKRGYYRFDSTKIKVY